MLISNAVACLTNIVVVFPGTKQMRCIMGAFFKDRPGIVGGSGEVQLASRRIT